MKKTLFIASIAIVAGALFAGKNFKSASAEAEVPYYDPAQTYYESDNFCTYGDFEKFEEGYQMKNETKDQGGIGTVSPDNPATVVTLDGSKVARIGRMSKEDSKEYSTMFYLIPTVFEQGEMMRISYDLKLNLSEKRSTYPAMNSQLVGASNVGYYNIKLKYDDVKWPAKTNGKEAAGRNVDIYFTELENDWWHVECNIGICEDIAYWDSYRFLIVSLNYGDCMYVDNIKICKLSTGKPTNPLTSLTISEGDIDLKVGEEKQLTLVETPNDHDEVTFAWSSSNTNVATVENGKVVAVGEGAAEITVLAGNGVKTSIVVVVSAAEQPQKGGCNGSIIVPSLVTCITALCAGLFLKKKRQ